MKSDTHFVDFAQAYDSISRKCIQELLPWYTIQGNCVSLLVTE